MDFLCGALKSFKKCGFWGGFQKFWGPEVEFCFSSSLSPKWHTIPILSGVWPWNRPKIGKICKNMDIFWSFFGVKRPFFWNVISKIIWKYDKMTFWGVLRIFYGFSMIFRCRKRWNDFLAVVTMWLISSALSSHVTTMLSPVRSEKVLYLLISVISGKSPTNLVDLAPYPILRTTLTVTSPLIH